MANEFNVNEAITIDQDNRAMAASTSPGAMSAILNDIYNRLTLGTIGTQSLGADIDSICLGGGAFTIDAVDTVGLVFAWLASRFHNGLGEVAVSAGNLTLTPSTTNYVELDRSGAVSANTSGFTSGRMPLYQIVTGASTIATVTNKKPVLTLIGPAGVTGTMLSTVGATKTEQHQLGSISGTTSFLWQADCAGTITGVSFVCATAVAANNTNYWTFALTDLGAAGSGAQQILAATAINTTQLTGGVSITANVVVTLTLSGTLTVAAGDVLKLTLTATGTPTTMNECAARVDQSFSS